MCQDVFSSQGCGLAPGHCCGSVWGALAAPPAPPRAGFPGKGEAPGVFLALGVGFALQPCAQVPVVGQGEAGGGSSTFGGALLRVAVAVAPGEVDQHPLPLLSLSHQRERLQEPPARRKGGSERGCWPRWGWKGVICPPPSPTPCGGDAWSCAARRDLTHLGGDGRRKKLLPTCSGSVWDGIPGKAALHPGEAAWGPSC